VITEDLSAMAQAAKYWPRTVKPRVQPLVTSCEMVGEFVLKHTFLIISSV
jgi:hypothetical protein